MTTGDAAQLRAIPALTGKIQAAEQALPQHPVELFRRWLQEALDAGVPEPHAMTLSTVDAQGLPDARVLILKDIDERGWAFASPASSAKGEQLAGQPFAALSFWWQPLVRAVRIRGAVVEASREECQADLAARSAEARAAVSPGDWRLWRVQPSQVEFWQGATDRRHSRIMYTCVEGKWSHSR